MFSTKLISLPAKCLIPASYRVPACNSPNQGWIAIDLLRSLVESSMECKHTHTHTL